MALAGSDRNRRAAPRRGRLTRRAFLGTAGVAGTLLLRQGRALSYEANEQLQVAVVGLGGRGSGFAVEEGWSSVRQQTGGRIAALCDVNKKKAAAAFQRYPDVPEVRGLPRDDRPDGVEARRRDRRHARPRPRRPLRLRPPGRQARVLREGADPHHPGIPHPGGACCREEAFHADGQPGRLQRPRGRERMGGKAWRNPDHSHVGRRRCGSAAEAVRDASGARLPQLGPLARPGGLSPVPPRTGCAMPCGGTFPAGIPAGGAHTSGPRCSRR